MKVNVYRCDDITHNRVLDAFFDGIPPWVERKLLHVQNYEPSDVAVVFGVRKKAVAVSQFRGEVIRQQQESGRQVVVLETGYINRGDGEGNHFAAGFDHINGWADFRNADMPKDRWERLGVELKPWTFHRDGYVLLCGQVPWDAQVDSIDYLKWLEETVEQIRVRTDRRIVFRPHPKCPTAAYRKLGHVTVSEPGRPFAADLRNAYVTVAYNSNALVESVIAGVPAIALGSGSMAEDVTSRTLSDLEAPLTPDRHAWAWSLAYSQWLPAEMRAGETWRHLFRDSPRSA